VGGWLGDFLRIYKIREFHTLHVNSMWWEIDTRVIFPLFFGIFPKKCEKLVFFVHTKAQDLQKASISNSAFKKQVVGGQYTSNLFF